MNETLTTVRGTVITNPSTRRVGEQTVVRFRMASNSRYQDRETGEWRTGGTLYLSVACWGRLAQRAGGLVAKGDGLLVQGRLQTNEYEVDGVRRSDLEMRAAAMGPDLSRMDVTFRRREGEGSAAGEDDSAVGVGDTEDGMDGDDTAGPGEDGHRAVATPVLAGSAVGADPEPPF